MSHEVEIVHPKTGERYGVTVTDYRRLYEDRGFKIDRNADQTEYVAPEPKASRTEPKASRAEAPASPAETKDAG